MRQISKVLARRVSVAIVVVVLAVPFAGAATREHRDPGFEGPAPRLVKVIKVVKKVIKGMGDLLSDPKP
jgi:hypothetical protein